MTGSGLAPATMDHAGRLAALRVALGTHEVDAFVVTNLLNVRYLSGFTGSNGVLVVTGDDARLVTDGRYREQAAAELGDACVDGPIGLTIESIDFDGALAAAVAGRVRVGLEAATITWAAQRRYAERFAGSELVPLSNVVELLRAVKDAGEIERIERAAEIADAALAQSIGRLHGRPTERDFAFTLETAMRRMGADGPSFDTIVASGPNGARPHARPSSRRIERGDLVVLDFGAKLGGYHSDMTRTVCVGPPSPQQRRLFDVVLAAHETARSGVRAGVATKGIDALARGVIGEAGWAEQFDHGTGHGIGLAVHEYPILSRATPGALERDYVVTVEPGVYLAGLGGVRVEDTVVVGESGCRSLTLFPKSLEV